MIGSPWLIDDMLRVEELLLTSVGSSEHSIVNGAATHLIKAGGKRLRPALVLLSSHAGRWGTRETDLAAAAIELVHLATLYHDDVIDQTETRRGAPTVHSKWGTEVAILAGDYLFAHGCALGAEAGGEVPLVLARAVADVCEGQITETTNIGDPSLDVERYLDTIRRKTAALFRAACELGAATSGVGPGHRAALMSYGENLGLAFQIVDDLLDLVGDPHTTGKALGTDLREGVFTLPVLIGSRNDEGLRSALDRGERDIESVLPALHATGAIEQALAEAKAHSDRAVEALAQIGPDAEWKEALIDSATGVLAQVPSQT